VYAETQSSVPDAAVLVGKGGSYEPHNVWFLAAIELGLPGLLLLALVFALTFIEAVRLPPSLRGPPVSAFVATIFAALFLSNLEFKFFWMALILVSLSRNLALQVEQGEVARRPTPAERV
jgi:O-antigen ligase